ncbi:hypothetical protein [Fluviispira multicolorata]|uniref:Uncharacterized protein n=1 Tax=Fluviispira multicolorata TaxID=2654512 RepID=A0A833N2T1_9BACT|nr:hypothetical protein [Fluviispira multicolorata]KAB8033263.1 hypothetical protein GCL57_00785 [Fluviispira multicolorata]
MIKKRILVTSSCFLSTIAIVGCGGKQNINMQTQSNRNNVMYDKFATQLCLPTSAEAVSLSGPNVKENLVNNLKQNPKCFNPDPTDPIKQKKYEQNRDAVNKYVAEMAPKIVATEIISFDKFSDYNKNREIDFKEFTDGHKISLKYLERKDPKLIGEDPKPIELSNIKTSSGLNAESKFDFFGTTKGKIDRTKISKGSAYILKYRLAKSQQIYAALITIPEDTKKIPLMLYAHGGDAGISFRELATLLQDNLSNYIVAAPAFPGESICSVDKKTGDLTTLFKRSCVDSDGNEIEAGVEPFGKRSPLVDDVVATLGLHSALSKIALGELKLENNKNLKEIKTRLEFYSEDISLVKKIAGPKTVAAASSRGGATMLAALGRSGVMLQQALEKLEKDGLKDIYFPPLFSSAAVYYGPSTFLVGKFRILFQDILSGSVFDHSGYNVLPMIPDLNKNHYIVNYRKAPLDNSDKKLKEMIGFLGASDITYLAPYISVSTQNWSNNINEIKKLLMTAEFDALLKKALGELGQKNINIENNTGEVLIKKVIGDLLNYLIAHKNGDKSLLKFISEAIVKPNINLSPDICSINAAIFPAKSNGNCSLRGILTHGIELNLPDENQVSLKEGLFAESDQKGIEKFALLLDTLSNDKEGLKNIVDALNSVNNNESIVKSLFILKASLEKSGIKLESTFFTNFIKFLVSASVSAINNNEPSITDDDVKKISTNALYFVMSAQNLIMYKDNIMKMDFLTFLKGPLNFIKNNREASPGALLLLHNTQDQIVDYSQSLITKTALDTVFGMSFGTGSQYFPLNALRIPPIGSQFIGFQPESKFYKVSVGDKYLKDKVDFCSDKKDKNGFFIDANYNDFVKKCFTRKGNYAHGDASFLTGKVINSHLLTDNEGAIEDALLFGYDENKTSQTSIEFQIIKMNEAFKVIPDYVKPEKHSYDFKTQCDTYNANCFIFGTLKKQSDGTWSAPRDRTPLYNRTLFQVQDLLEMKVAQGGFWSQRAEQFEGMTPTDVLSKWLKTSATEAFNIQ